ncbi:ribose phosphate diphosphokinase [Aureococcus anophagefferens]|nr:ribose phosphate diphosphokinase [Aureococcus anophagefferens]
MLVALLCSLAALCASAFQAPRAATLPRARAAAADKDAGAYRELYEKAEYERQRAAKAGKRYQIIASPATEAMARAIEASQPDRFHFHESSWDKFPDGTDKIVVGGFSPRNLIAGEHVLMLCSFHDNDVTLSQFQVMVMLLQGFIKSLTIVLPFYPTGTMERVVLEGEVATANTRRSRLLPYLEKSGVDAVAFPDDGAAKRFKHMFDPATYEIIVCGKIRDGDVRSVTVQDGDPAGRNVVIVDDLVQTGGTLYECGVALEQLGAAKVSAFVAHGVFPQDAWLRCAAATGTSSTRST